MKTLKDVMPWQFSEFGGEFNDTKAYQFKDVEVVKEHGIGMDWDGRHWIGKHKHVYFWVELSNGYAVAFNENPARGWSFPVVKIKR